MYTGEKDNMNRTISIKGSDQQLIMFQKKKPPGPKCFTCEFC